MPIKWTIFLLTLYFVCAFLSGILEDAYLGGDSASTINTLLAVQVFSWHDVAGGVLRVPTPNPEFLTALKTVVFFEFAMFETGLAQLIKYLFWIVGGACLLSFTITGISLIRGGGGVTG